MFIDPVAIRLLRTAMAQECANLIDDEAVAHRQTVSQAQPSLPQRTGRSIKVLRHVVENQTAPSIAS